MSPAVIAWQPLLTPHQSHTLAALRQELGGRLRVIVDRVSDPVREAQGWQLDSGLACERLPDSGWRERIGELLDADPDAVHLVGSPFERSRLNHALIAALRRRRQVFLISEPYCPVAVGYQGDRPSAADRAKAMLRPLLYTAYGRMLRTRLTGVFAISSAAVRQYRRMGMPAGRVLPFGYFVPGEPPAERARRPGPLRLAYLGSFIARKGVETLLEAARLVASEGLELDLYGPGWSDRPLPSRVRYRGQLPFGRVETALRDYDLVVVPSLFDGWAVVVNEALQAGVPVVASDAVGAGGMLAKWNCGRTFPARDAGALAAILREFARSGELRAGWQANAVRLAPVLQPEYAGRYMNEGIAAVLAGRSPPPCPWYDV